MQEPVCGEGRRVGGGGEGTRKQAKAETSGKLPFLNLGPSRVASFPNSSCSTLFLFRVALPELKSTSVLPIPPLPQALPCPARSPELACEATLDCSLRLGPQSPAVAATHPQQCR